MNINDFINEYNEAQNKEKYLKKHIVTDYLSWTEKVLEAQKIVQMSCYENDGDRFKINSPLRYYLYVLAIVRSYTDIEIEKNRGIQSFDLLEKNGVTTLLLNQISDVKSFQTVLNWTLDDHMMNYRDMTSWLDGKGEALKELFDAMNDAIPVNDNGKEAE